jgi:CcmD family protein
MSTGTQYVVAAYAVIWFVLMLYVVVVAARTQRIARELEVVLRLAEERGEESLDAVPHDEAAPRERAPEPTR